MVIAHFLNRRMTRTVTEGDRAGAAADEPLGREGGFELIRKDRYLMLIAVLSVVLNVVNTSGEYLFGATSSSRPTRCVRREPRPRARGPSARPTAYLFSAVNLLGFLLQMFVVSRVFKFLGVGRSLFIHPVVALDRLPADDASAVGPVDARP